MAAWWESYLCLSDYLKQKEKPRNKRDLDLAFKLRL